MGAGKSEAGISVVESGGAPDDGVVARGAERSGEASGYVIGNATADRLRAAPIGCVAAVAIGIRRSQGIVSAHVALGAGGDLARGRHLVGIRECEARGAVVKHAVGPHRDAMATGASRGTGGE